MPAVSSDGAVSAIAVSAASSADPLPRKSQDKTLKGVFAVTNGTGPDRGLPDHRPDPFRALSGLKNNSFSSLPNGTAPGSTNSGRERSHSKAGSTHSVGSARGRLVEAGRFSLQEERQQRTPVHEYLPNGHINGVHRDIAKAPARQRQAAYGELFPSIDSRPLDDLTTTASTSDAPQDALNSSGDQPPANRFSSPPTISSSTSQGASSAAFPRLTHRHTLTIPKISTMTSRPSREFSFNAGQSEETISAAGRMSPIATDPPRNRRASLGLARRTTKSLQSDAHLDEYPPDEEAMRWTEAIRQKRASRRKRKEEDDDDRVIVGTKVDQGHVNWVTAYNMLTGIRFTVSRTNAKMDRELTEADFDARHKFSFDVTGNELTPSAKYDFKFKDYSPWVFRHLRSIFGLDPADYLMSLTSKYILSELGSPGKSGSFFYFSRDYKYIIKTIHHAEHKLLRKILREYYKHAIDNPNTLISQFYGLHRVKIPYGRKIHFVVMNNLFPPHRDIHQMFDLKGSTIGRDFREEDLAKNPRATLKDLNWLRRDLHLELGPGKREAFIEQMKRDVSLLQRLHIMDYSMLVGIHDLEKGNEENVRENMLKVFQPGGERIEGDMTNMLTRTPSRMENARKAKQLRLTLKKEKPIPMGMVQAKMPDEMADERKDRIFYSDDGGFHATHENGQPGEVTYYLGVIDCLTHYGFVKHLEHFWKGLSDPKSQISPVPPDEYGNRFINFITGITITEEEAERKKASEAEHAEQSLDHTASAVDGATRSLDAARMSSHSDRLPRSPVDKAMEKAQKQAEKSERKGANEQAMPDRTLGTMRSSSAERSHGQTGSTLPVVEEAGEAGSTGGRSGGSVCGNAVEEKERGRSREGDSQGDIRRVVNGEQPMTTEKAHDFVDAPALPPLTTSPTTMDPEKRLVARFEKPDELDLGHAH